MEQIITGIAILVFSVIAHELAHGYAALKLGDRTAESAGRLTVNPIAHIDVLGSIVVPLLTVFAGGPVLGWAKPVPYNPYNLSDQRYGAAKVAIAGPVTNFAIAIIFAIILANAASLGIGSASQILVTIISINIGLAVFNLCPIPPLDGFTVLAGIIPSRHAAILHTLERYSFVFLIAFIYLGGTLILSPIIKAFMSFLV